MKIFVDSSFLFPLVHDKDEDHPRAERIGRWIASQSHELLTTNYVLVECISLIQRRVGMAAAARTAKYVAANATVIWMDEARHRAVMHEWEREPRRGLSIVDCSSFSVMREEGITDALAFDRHFRDAGFRLLDAPPALQVQERRGRYRASSRTPS